MSNTLYRHKHLIRKNTLNRVLKYINGYNDKYYRLIYNIADKISEFNLMTILPLSSDVISSVKRQTMLYNMFCVVKYIIPFIDKFKSNEHFSLLSKEYLHKTEISGYYANYSDVMYNFNEKIPCFLSIHIQTIIKRFLNNSKMPNKHYKTTEMMFKSLNI
jgi:hypothetical protein